MIVLPLFLLSFVFISDATICYQCSDAKSGGMCKHDVQGMLADRTRLLNMSDVENSDYNSKFTYLKNCVNAWGEYCLIENIREAGTGQLFSFIRGCTDGKIFSLTDFPNRTIVSDNQTTCAFRPGSGKVVVCLTMCKTDFCNGPLPDMNNGGITSSLSPVLFIPLLLAVITSILYDVRCW